MNAEYITFRTNKSRYKVPNRWELLPPDIFGYLVLLLSQMAIGKIDANIVRFLYVCRMFDINLRKIRDFDAMANLKIIADQIDFIFDKEGKVNACFLAQLVPKFGKYKGYQVKTSMDTLTCSLTAIQLIESQEALKGGVKKLPLLAAILYCPAPYSSEKAHALAGRFIKDPVKLQAVALNFQALVTYLFTKTHFSILASGSGLDHIPEIATGMIETLYNLSTDGMGDVQTVEQMPVIKFLTILRKKLIESVKAMHDAKMDIVEISQKTKLDTQLIKKII
jgi:hypothetical protein